MHKGIIAVASVAVISLGTYTAFLFNDLNKTKENVNLLEKEKSKLTERIDDRDETILAYQVEEKRLEELIVKLRKDSRVKDNKIKKLEEKADGLEEDIVELESEAKELKNEVKELKKKDSLSLSRVKASENSSDSEVHGEGMKFTVTHYTALDGSQIGITKSGVDVRNTIYHNGYRIVASDSSVIPIGSIIEISFGDNTFIKAQVHDTGDAIKSNKLDLLVASKEEAYRLGVRTGYVKILRRGW